MAPSFSKLEETGLYCNCPGNLKAELSEGISGHSLVCANTCGFFLVLQKWELGKDDKRLCNCCMEANIFVERKKKILRCAKGCYFSKPIIDEEIEFAKRHGVVKADK